MRLPLYPDEILDEYPVALADLLADERPEFRDTIDDSLRHTGPLVQIF